MTDSLRHTVRGPRQQSKCCALRLPYATDRHWNQTRDVSWQLRFLLTAANHRDVNIYLEFCHKLKKTKNTKKKAVNIFSSPGTYDIKDSETVKRINLFM